MTCAARGDVYACNNEIRDAKVHFFQKTEATDAHIGKKKVFRN